MDVNMLVPFWKLLVFEPSNHYKHYLGIGFKDIVIRHRPNYPWAKWWACKTDNV